MSEPYDDDPYDYEYQSDLVICPRCNGDGEVNCYCAGDLCLCENHGDAPCPVCHGEGEVTEERNERYLANEREMMEAFRQFVDKEPTT